MLHNRLWIQLESNKEDTILTFDHLMTALVFCCDYQRAIRNYSQNAVMKEKTRDISDLIITILKHLLSIPITKTQRSKLKRNLSIYIHEHNLPEEEKRPNLLMEVSSSYEGNTLDLKLIKLLLKVGENPNVVGFRHNSPLHLLVMEEIESSHEWLNHDYSERSQQFTSVVQSFIDGGFDIDQINAGGRSELECFTSSILQYPDTNFSNLLEKLVKKLRPLYFIAAKNVRRHQIPYGDIPVTLKDYVKKIWKLK